MGHSIDPRSKSGGTAPTDPDGVPVLVVRKDSAGAIDADGDLTTLQVDADGALKVTGTASANTQYDIDTPASGSESGMVAVVVRNDSGGSLVTADGDLAPLQVDANGALRVSTGGGTGPTPVTDNGGSLTVDDGGGSLTVDGTVYAAQDGAWSVSVNNASIPVTDNGGSLTVDGTVTVANASIPVTDNGGSLTVDGTVGVSGTVTVGTHAVTYPSSRLNGAISTSGEFLLPVCGMDAGGTWRALLVDSVASGSAALLTKSDRKPTPYKLNSAASTNATSVSATANTLLLGYYISNTNSSVRYVKFYNKASAPTVGTDTPVLVLAIPGSGAANVSFPDGINFTTGLAFATTTGAADSDTGAVAANEVIVNLVYATY